LISKDVEKLGKFNSGVIKSGYSYIRSGVILEQYPEGSNLYPPEQISQDYGVLQLSQ
jgi:hypothetical protein